MADVYMRILMSAQTGSTISAISSVTQALGKGGLGGALLGIGLAAAGAAVAFGVQSVQAFTNYQAAMVQLQNTTGSSDAQMKQYAATIRQVSDTTGVAQTNLAAGMYQIVSANFAGADATRILTTATQAAVIANANQAQVTTGLVVTLNAFGLKASQVDTISNQMFKTLSLGRGNISDLSGALQTGGSLVAHYGVSVTDMDAILATLSTGGMKTFGTSMTGLTQLLNVMDGKTDTMAKRIHKLGIPFDEAKFKSMGVQQQIAYLNKTLENNKGQTVAILGSKQAATALGILGTHADLLASNTKKLSDSQVLAKEKSDAWAKTQQTAAFQMQLFQTHVQNLQIDLGAKLLPIINNVIGGIGNFVVWVGNIAGNFVTWVQKSGILQNALNIAKTAIQDVKNVISGTISVVMSIVNWFIQWRVPILAVASAITLFILPALIQMGVQAAIAGGQAIAGLIGQLVTLATQAGAAGLALITDTIPALISMATQAIVTAATAIPGLVMGFISWAVAGWSAAAATIAATWPILLIIVAIAALVAIIILLATHWTQVTSWIGQQMSRLGGFVHLQVQLIGMAFSMLGTWVHNALTFVGNLFSQFGTDVHNVIFGIIGWFQALPGQVVTWITSLVNQGTTLFKNFWTNIVSSAKNIFGTLSSAISGILKGAINTAIIDPLDFIIQKIDSIHVSTPFGNVGFSIPQVPHLAFGGTLLTGGWAVVGERGPELANLPGGTTVYPHGTGPAGGGGGGPIIYISISTMARSQSEIRRMVDMVEQEMGRRMRSQTPSYNSANVF